MALRYAARLNTMTQLVITSPDVLSGLTDLGLHQLPRRRRRQFDFPYHQIVHLTVASLTELRGWKEDLGECRSPADLPEAALEYLQFISEHTGVPVGLVGVGPGRDQVIWTEAAEQSLVAPVSAGS